MKIIKKILFICMIFILTGCSVEYSLKINEDNTVSEKVIATENTNRMESITRQKGNQAVSYLYNMFKRDGSSINSRTDGNSTIATSMKIHNNIDEYSSDFTSDIFKEMVVTRKDGIVTLTANQDEILSNESSNSLIYDEIKISIIVPYTVVENNADNVSRNTYTWNIKKNDDLKTIKISYKEGNKKDKININLNNKTYNINYGMVTGIIIGLIILTIFLTVLIKNRKNNVV